MRRPRTTGVLRVAALAAAVAAGCALVMIAAGAWSPVAYVQVLVLALVVAVIHVMARRLSPAWGAATARAVVATALAVVVAVIAALLVAGGLMTLAEVGYWVLCVPVLVLLEGLGSAAVVAVRSAARRARRARLLAGRARSR